MYNAFVKSMFSSLERGAKAGVTVALVVGVVGVATYPKTGTS